jgi:CHAD domain-containing protein
MRLMSKEEPMPIPLLVYTDELIDKLRAMLPRAIKEWDGTAIHQARVATRRLKAASDVFNPISTKSHRREFVKILRRLRRHLGPSRDLDVMLGHLKETKSQRLKSGLEWLQIQLSQKQKFLHESEAEKFDLPEAMARLGAWWGVREDWAEAADGLDCLISESLHLQLDRFIEQANAVAGKVPETHAESNTEPHIDPHQLRIAGKALRYTLEMGVASGHRLPASVGRAFKRMQDALGLWHDYVVLADCILDLSVKSMLGHRDPAMQASVLDIAKMMVGRSGLQLSKFNKLWHDRGEMLAATIRRSFPLTSAVIELKTDPDPTATEQSADSSPPTPAPNETSAA